MEDPKATSGKSPVTPSSRSIAESGVDIAALLDELFNDPNSGAYIQGVVVSADEPSVREGKNDKGRDYKFISRRIQVQTKDAAFICAETRDRMEDFKPIPKYSRIKWPIVRARMDGSQMVFNVLI